jgi:hypothetical protein
VLLPLTLTVVSKVVFMPDFTCSGRLEPSEQNHEPKIRRNSSFKC